MIKKLNASYQSQIIRYCIVGMVNTAVTIVVIFTLTALKCGIYVSNASGYVIGIAFSYLFNSYFTFSINPSAKRLFRFILCCILCYLINIAAIKLSLTFFSNDYIVQVIGMVFYTATGFAINKYWVMK